MRLDRSPDEVQRNPGYCEICEDFPDYAMLHPGYLLNRCASEQAGECNHPVGWQPFADGFWFITLHRRMLVSRFLRTASIA